ncbi:hypothetical protein ACFV1T_36955, partial [Streptomyces vinaceus]
MTNPSVEPVRMTNPVRLDDLIEAIKKVHTDTLEQLSGAVVGPGWRGGGRGAPHPPRRRPAPPPRPPGRPPPRAPRAGP